jgi:hypothetical protein
MALNEVRVRLRSVSEEFRKDERVRETMDREKNIGEFAWNV